MELLFLGCLGACLGSFLNVVIHRLPRNESVVYPPSHCPFCGHRIRPWENIPIISYVMLRGRCSACHTPIPPRYLLVEIITPALLLMLYAYQGPTLTFIKHAVLVLFLIPITFIDLDHKLILNRLTLPGMLIGLMLSIAQNPAGFYRPVMGLVAGGGLLWLIALFGQVAYKQESMGGGDIKLGAMIGAFMSAESTVLALFMAFFIAAVFVLAGMAVGKLRRRSTIPFGPFIALGSLLVIGFKDQLIRAYLNLVLN